MMREILCFFCNQDVASQTVWTNILQDFNIAETGVEFDGKSVSKHETSDATFWLAPTQKYIYKNGKYYAQLTAKVFPNAELAVIVGFHEGKSGAILTVHSIGNPSALDGPYTPKYTLAETSCRAIKNTIKGFKKYMDEFSLTGFEVMQEVTHGSPVDFDIPIVDFEIGSTRKEYENMLAGNVLAHTLFHIDDPIEFVPAIGFGGLHYAEKFMKANLYGKYAVGHIFPSASLRDFNKQMLTQTIEKTTEGSKAIVIDKKEKGKYKAQVRKFAEELGLEVLTHKQAAKPS